MLPLKNKTFSITVQGCRTNQYEGEAIAALLEKAGAVHDESSPDMAVIVSCTITASADRKCRKIIRKLRREHPGILIAACGCYAQKLTEKDRDSLGIDIVIGNRLKYKIADLAAKWFSDGGLPNISIIEEKNILRENKWDSLELDRPRLHTRAFLKVQDGCNHYCSYCIVPYVRGNPVSRNMDDAVAEAEKIAASGCPEIVLTGIHLGLYDNLPLLVSRIGAVRGLKRLRFGSIEPFAVDNKLLDVLADTEIFCRHLHMPLQSGDDKVLSIMKRGYDSDGFRRIADNARERLGGDLHISTDLMVGFPGEDEVSFKNSMNFVKEIAFGKVHVFPYSPREGTEAAKMQLPPAKEVQERTDEALAAAAELHEKYCSRWIGSEAEVLVEERKDGIIRGLTKHYVRVTAKEDGTPSASITSVIPKSYAHEMLFCEGAEDVHGSEEFGEVI